MGENRASWALDDVYIGGHEVNVPALQSDLELLEIPAGNIGMLWQGCFALSMGSHIQCLWTSCKFILEEHVWFSLKAQEILQA